MSKKVNLVFIGLFFAAIAIFLMVKDTEAFCVYNETDALIKVQQTSGHKTFQGFSEYIDPGDKKCCNWGNTDCNKEAKRDSIVKFTVSYVIVVEQPFFGPTTYYRTVCFEFPIKADDRLTIKGHRDNYRCEAH